MFQVEALEEGVKPKVELTIDTRQRPELNAAFQRLFEAAKSSVDAQSAKILRELAG